MQQQAVLFDLDGTLLPMDQDAFTKGYFKLLVRKLAPYGYEPQQLIDGIWAGTAAMVANDGSEPNEAAFWRRFAAHCGESVLARKPLFEEFYAKDFQEARALCGFDPQAAETVRLAKSLGYRVVLATNPIFPAVATESRIRWAGLTPEDFELYTTYESIGYCKPNPDYYREILKKIALEPSACFMVGNDATEDVAAEEAGLRVFLLTDCLINKEGRDISRYAQGSFPQLQTFLERHCVLDIPFCGQ